MINATYIIAQIYIILMFICLGISYFCESRKKILIVNILAQVLQSIAFFLLNGFTGVAMSYVMLVSDLILYIEHEKKKENNIRNILVLTFLLIMTFYGVLVSYHGLLSLLSVVATIILLFGIWQNDIQKYKIFGLIGSAFWLLYYFYLKSYLSISLEIILIICMIISFYKKKV